jgi:hypothetical protein
LKRSEKYFIVVLCVVLIALVSEILVIVAFSDLFSTDTAVAFFHTLKQVILVDIF